MARDDDAADGGNDIATSSATQSDDQVSLERMRERLAPLVRAASELNDRGQLIAVVEDDGTGFSGDAVEPGRDGLVGMRERVTLAGGTLDFESEPAAGTTVIVTIPMSGSPR